jgi:hypothetical protein
MRAYYRGNHPVMQFLFCGHVGARANKNTVSIAHRVFYGLFSPDEPDEEVTDKYGCQGKGDADSHEIFK